MDSLFTPSDSNTYCVDLSQATSPNLQSATGRGVLEPFMTIHAEPSHPTWKPHPLGPLSHSGTKGYFQRISTLPPPALSAEFHFYHADLSPTNILISDTAAISSILDWESAGFYPTFWIPLKPWRSGGFNLDIPDDGDERYEWTDLLEEKLADVGFSLDLQHVKWQKSLDFSYFDLGELGDEVM